MQFSSQSQPLQTAECDPTGWSAAGDPLDPERQRTRAREWPAELPERADIVVVGATLIGLATAVELAELRPDSSIVVLEKERDVALHQSGRNSCVIHSGIYYAPGSLKARLCRDGRRRLLEFCEERGIEYDLCGKVIVATDERERQKLEQLAVRGRANGVQLHSLDVVELAELEPACRGVAAILLPEAGLVDYRAVAAALATRLCELGGRIVVDAEVVGVASSSASVRLTTRRGSVEASFAIGCAGLQSDRLARAGGGEAVEHAIVPFKGSYFALRADAPALCRQYVRARRRKPGYPRISATSRRSTSSRRYASRPRASTAFGATHTSPPGRRLTWTPRNGKRGSGTG